MEGAHRMPYATAKGASRKKVAEEIFEYSIMTTEQGMKKVHQLEKKMYEHAKNLEFEQAAKMRDEISRAKEILLKNDKSNKLKKNITKFFIYSKEKRSF